MNNQTIVCCVVSLLLGMLLFHMLKNVCGCKVVEGQEGNEGNEGKCTHTMEALGLWGNTFRAYHLAGCASLSTRDDCVNFNKGQFGLPRGRPACEWTDNECQIGTDACHNKDWTDDDCMACWSNPSCTGDVGTDTESRLQLGALACGVSPDQVGVDPDNNAQPQT